MNSSPGILYPAAMMIEVGKTHDLNGSEKVMKKKLFVSLLIGVLAAVIDVTPGIIRGIDITITFTGFSFWVLMGPTIAFISLPVRDWLKGLIVASLLSIPGTILMSLVDPNTVLPMFLLALVLGSLVGFLNGMYAK